MAYSYWHWHVVPSRYAQPVYRLFNEVDRPVPRPHTGNNLPAAAMVDDVQGLIIRLQAVLNPPM